MPLVSVIVPFYNVEEFLDACLASIARQTHPDLECLLVDDGSPDGSRAIAERWAAADPRFRIITQENKGLAAARNTGTRESRGEYLIFIDSDDLLAPRALEQFVTSLEASGSDFAAAHVWRLPLTRPVEPSWAHTEPFAERRQRTSIREIPLLMRDRMAWNKMWRRSFWEQGDYAWPEMRFEDFPVSMRAHLEATAVDVLPDPVYVWRERPVGQSISGQGRALVNVQDRVRAAGMVMDIVDERGDDELRELVHSHLVDVDLREVMSSLLTGHEDDQPAIEELAHELGQRIDPACVGLAQPELQEAYRAARENDIATLRAIARRRAGGPARAARSRADLAKAAPGIAMRKARTAARKASALSTHRSRTGRLVEARIEQGQFVFRVEIAFDARLKEHATVSATISGVEAEVESTTTPTGLLCDLTVDAMPLAQRGGFQPLQIDVAALGLRFSGHVIADATQLLGLHEAGYWLQTMMRGGRLGLERARRVALIESLHAEGRQIVARLNVSEGTLVVEQPWPSDGVEIPVVDHEARFDLHEIVAGDPADNPVTDIASRRFLLRTVGGEENVRLSGPGLRQRLAGRDVEIRRSDDGSAFLVHRPL